MTLLSCSTCGVVHDVDVMTPVENDKFSCELYFCAVCKSEMLYFGEDKDD
jgi:hypothetical protein